VFDAAARVAAQRERIAPKGAAEAKLAPKGKGWVAELETISDSAELVATGLRIVAEGRAAEGQVAEEMERLGGSEARRGFMQGEEAFFKNSETQLEREVEPEAGPEVESEPEAEPAPEAEAAAAPEDGEEAYVEDSENDQNNVRRRLWRVQSALGWVEPDGPAVERVGGILWRMSEGARPAGCEIWVKWFSRRGSEEEARRRWANGFDGWAVSVNWLYGVAQRAGWRYPLAQNLNKLEEMAERVEAALRRAKVDIYQAGKRLVRPVQVEVDAAKGRKTKIAVLVAIDHAFLKSEVTRIVDFFKWKKEEREGVAPPADVINAVLSRYGKWKFPAISGVITAPTLRRDGSVLATEGYDEATGLLVMGPLPEMPALAKKPTREDAEKAMRVLDRELLSGFPWVSEASRSAGLSGLISPCVRAALTCVPLHASTAPEPGTGKTFLWDICGGVTIGDAMPIMAAGANLEELEKRLNAKLISGIGMLSIDNIPMPLGGDALCQAVERPTYSARVLGTSEAKEWRNTWCLYASGNNLRLRDDITRRTLLVQMDAKTERPELRQFRSNPFEMVLADRGRYIWAALTIVLAYRAAGMPGRLPGIGDPFSEWSDLVRSALVWLGYADPVLTMEDARDNDPSRQARIAMFQAMVNAYGDDGRTAAEMIDDAKAGGFRPKAKSVLDVVPSRAAEDLKAAIVQYTQDRLDAKYLGNKLGTDKNKITGGLCLRTEYDSHRKVNRWYVEQI
jgi:putative DNA primase/helicase